MNARQAVLISLGGGLIALVFSLVLANAWLIGLSAVLLCLSVVIQRFGGVLLPYFLKGLSVVETRGGWVLDRDVAVLHDGDRYLASAYLDVDVHFSPSRHPAEASVSYGAAFEKALCGLSFPAQFGLLVYPIDLEKYRESVLTQRLEAELSISRIKQSPTPDASALASAERKKAMATRVLNQLSAGQRPLDAVYYVSTTAAGPTHEQAAESARLQARELRAVLSHALNAQVRPLDGDALRRCLDWKVAIARDGLGSA
ncbi:hypothetical protein HY994_04695 [Candidatus Micrarchaeota archaeon]|nr:hypothetical protein [Candidatus Micrarchaeota archaeon]